MTKKPYKIIKTEQFKKKEKNLPPKLKKDLDKALKKMAKDPMNCPHSMNLFSKPTPEELRKWMGKIKPDTIHFVFEYLNQKGCLSYTGKELAKQFFDKYVKVKDD